MNIKNIIASLGIASLLIMPAACGGNKENKGGENAADIEAAAMEGREAARIFLNRPWRDTIELQRQLLEARAKQSKYSGAGKQQSAAAFDSAFVSTLKTVNPSVARELEEAAEAMKQEAGDK